MPTRVSIEEICEDFEDLDDPEDQLQYVIELGRELPGLPDEFKTEQNRVQGCQSNVWLIAQPVKDEAARTSRRRSSFSPIATR